MPQATQCDGSAGRSFRPDLPYAGLDGAAGASLEIADSTGDSVTVPFGVASFQTVHGGFSGVLHLRNLPAGGTTQITNGGSLGPTPVSSGSFDSGEIATPGAAVTVTATVGGKPVPRRARARSRSQPNVSVADGATSVTVHGADPAGGAVAIDLTAPGGALIAHTSAAARIGAGLDATATLPVRRPARVRRDRGTRRVVVQHAARDRRVHGRRVHGRDPRLGSGLRRRSFVHHGHLLLVARAARPCGLRRAAPTRSGRAPHSGPTCPP